MGWMKEQPLSIPKANCSIQPHCGATRSQCSYKCTAPKIRDFFSHTLKKVLMPKKLNISSKMDSGILDSAIFFLLGYRFYSWQQSSESDKELKGRAGNEMTSSSLPEGNVLYQKNKVERRREQPPSQAISITNVNTVSEQHLLFLSLLFCELNGLFFMVNRYCLTRNILQSGLFNMKHTTTLREVMPYMVTHACEKTSRD